MNPAAWMIRYNGTSACHTHNAIADYRAIDPDATVTPLFAGINWNPASASPIHSSDVLCYNGNDKTAAIASFIGGKWVDLWTGEVVFPTHWCELADLDLPEVSDA